MSDYKRRLIQTMNDIKKAIKEDDQQHLTILWDRLEMQIMGKTPY